MLVIFDCDGVLVDTEHLNRQALIAVLHRIGIDVTEVEATKHFHGLSNCGIVEKAEALWGYNSGTASFVTLRLRNRSLSGVMSSPLRESGVR